MTNQQDPPYHLVRLAPHIVRHIGPFSTYLDAVMARQIAQVGWRGAQIMSNSEFETHLAGGQPDAAY